MWLETIIASYVCTWMFDFFYPQWKRKSLRPNDHFRALSRLNMTSTFFCLTPPGAWIGAVWLMEAQVTPCRLCGLSSSKQREALDTWGGEAGNPIEGIKWRISPSTGRSVWGVEYIFKTYIHTWTHRRAHTHNLFSMYIWPNIHLWHDVIFY